MMPKRIFSQKETPIHRKVFCHAWASVVLFLLHAAVAASGANQERLLVDTGRVKIPGAYTRPHAPGVELGHITVDLPDIRWERGLFNTGTIHEYIEVISRPTDNPVRAIFVLEEGRINGRVVPFGHHWWGNTVITTPGVYTRQYDTASIKPQDGTRPHPNPLVDDPDSLTDPNVDVLRLDFVIQHSDYNVRPRTIPLDAREFEAPWEIRIMWVAVAEGATFSGWDNYINGSGTPHRWPRAVEMRDGAKLWTTIWRPGNGSYPTVLSRGYKHYGADGPKRHSKDWNRAGYAYAVQQCRAGGGEDGSRFFPDDVDGYDSIEWIAKQPFCDGKVAMYGGSYWGATQWRAVTAKPPSLKAIIPSDTGVDQWKYSYRSSGAVHLKMTSQGRVFPSGANLNPDEWRSRLMHLPLLTMDSAVSGSLGDNRLWNDYISHSSFDTYWKTLSMRDGDKYAQVDIPVYIMGGWRDYYGEASLEAFNALTRLGKAPDVRIRIANEGHTGRPDITESIRFLDYHLKGISNGLPDEPAIKFAVQTGDTKEDVQWREASRWPLPDTRFTKFYLSCPDGTKSGSLQTQPPGNETPTTYTYDPADPVETIAANGSHIYPPVHGLITDQICDLSSLESRSDVLAFTTSPLMEDTEVIGPIEAHIWASSSARDTDFIVRLTDVTPEGKALNVTEGIVRARFRNSIWEEPSLITPGKIYHYTIELMPAAIVFRKGHRIRVHVQCSCWPLWDRNQNTGNPIGMDSQVEVAEQTIYHDASHPSHILLPLRPAHGSASQNHVD